MMPDKPTDAGPIGDPLPPAAEAPGVKEDAVADGISRPHQPPAAAETPGAKKDVPAEGASHPHEERRRSWSAPEIILGIVAAVVAAIIGIAAILVAHWDAEQLKETVTGKFEYSHQKVMLDGKTFNPPKGPLQIQFWTPSVRTKETPGIKDWERVDSDTKLDVFGERLVAARILTGYRRYEVIGLGLGGRKSGAWWVSSNDSGFKLAEFLKVYQEFWSPGEDSVYMEIVPVTSGYGK
jgi:hypothetical protein